MLVAIYFGITRLGTLRTFTLVLPVAVLGSYLIFWLFSRGLPTTEPPPRPSPEYRLKLMRQGNRAFGRPLLWGMLVLSIAMAATGVWAGSITGQWGTASAAAAFFGLCAAIFAWQLRNQ
jgi:hypothetical protein